VVVVVIRNWQSNIIGLVSLVRLAEIQTRQSPKQHAKVGQLQTHFVLCCIPFTPCPNARFVAAFFRREVGG
jgi:hypothetical protein